MIILSKNDVVPRQFLLDTLRESMKKGIKIEVPTEDLEIASKRQKDALEVLQKEYGIDNPNSNKQLAQYAYEHDELLQYVQDERTGKISFAADNLTKLLDANIPIAGVLNRYKDATNIIKNVNMVISCMGPDSMVHPIVSTQNTNRISYTEPAIMNISKHLLWKMVKSRNPEYELWSVDVRNQEPWIMAHLVDDDKLKEIIQRSYLEKESFYKIIFETIYDRKVENEFEYSEFKMGWNMLTYGGTKKGLLEKCRAIDANALYAFFASLAGYKRYSAECWKMAARNVTTDLTYFGSEVHSDKVGKTKLAKSLADIKVQGTGADILAFLVKGIIDNINNDTTLRNRIEIYYTRHDELIFMVKRNTGETDADITKILHDISDHMIVGWVPFMTEIEKI